MIFFNNSEYRVYINGNIIEDNIIFKINNFKEQIIPLINNIIINNEIIDILYKVFIPATGEDLSYPYDCNTYETFKFKSLKNDGVIYYNNSKYAVTDFLDNYKDQSFGKSDIIMLHKNIE
jgi:hypothetical protein